MTGSASPKALWKLTVVGSPKQKTRNHCHKFEHPLLKVNASVKPKALLKLAVAASRSVHKQKTPNLACSSSQTAPNCFSKAKLPLPKPVNAHKKTLGFAKEEAATKVCVSTSLPLHYYTSAQYYLSNVPKLSGINGVKLKHPLMPMIPK